MNGRVGTWRNRACPSRALGVLLAAMLVAGQLAALGHLSLVRHAVCVEHGQLEHAEKASASPALAPQNLPMLEPGSEPRAHDHCECLGLVPERFVLTASVSSTKPCFTGSTVACAPSDVRGVGRAPLSVAPKQSPPIS